MALSQSNRRRRYLQEENSETDTGIVAPIINYNYKIEAQDNAKNYGLAYQNSYEDGLIYYGDMKDGNGPLPSCFPEDYECQKVSGQREQLMFGIVAGLAIIIMIGMVVGYCLCKKYSIRKSSENTSKKFNLSDVVQTD